MRAGWQQALLRAWAGRGALALALWPVSLLYGALLVARRFAYQQQWTRSCRVRVPVLVVGNVVAGGAGKTPTVLGVVEHLKAQGWQVGIVSRGYGRKDDRCRAVDTNSEPHEVGDEPLLLQRKTGVPVFVARKRAEAAKALLDNYPQTQLIICDDGLQHYALYRDVEICVLDSRGIGNGWLLPAGPLREPWPLCPVRKAGQRGAPLLLQTGASALPGYLAERKLASYSVGREGDQQPLSSLSAAGARPIMAVAGIAQPEAFFDMLRASGLVLSKTLALPDHYSFDSWSHSLDEGYTVICTEKDAAKVWQHVPQARAVPLIQTAPPAFYAALDRALQAHRPAPLSSSHGHPTS